MKVYPIFLNNLAGAEDTFRQVIGDISQQYTLGFTPPDAAQDGAWRPIGVKVSGGRYRIRARQGYALQTMARR